MKKYFIAILLLTSSMIYALPEQFNVEREGNFKSLSTFISMDYRSDDDTKSYGFKDILYDDNTIHTYTFIVEKKLSESLNCTFLVNDGKEDTTIKFQKVTYNKEKDLYVFESYTENEKYHTGLFFYVPSHIIHEKNVANAFFIIVMRDKSKENIPYTKKI